MKNALTIHKNIPVNLAQYAVYLQNHNSKHNGISSPLKMQSLNDLFRQDIDIVLLQEVTINDFSSLRGYEALVNEGTDKRGTTILLKQVNITK